MLLIVKNDERGQIHLQELLRSILALQSPTRGIKALRFDDGIPPKDNVHAEQEIIVSSLTTASWLVFNATLHNPVIASHLEDVMFPEYHPNNAKFLTRKKLNPTQELRLLDCNIRIEFDTQEHRPRQISIMARGRPACVDTIANGTPTAFVRGFINVCTPGSDIKLVTLIGAPNEKLVNRRYKYANAFSQIGLANPQQPINITNLTLRNYDCEFLSQQLFGSIHLSSIRHLTVIQCIGLDWLWAHFMTSSALTEITHLSIDLYDWEEPLTQGNLYGFEEFCKCFGSLEELNISTASAWLLDADALRTHSKLRLAELDLGTTLPLDSELQKLQRNHPELQELHYRDDELASPLAAGNWHRDYLRKIPGTASALVKMPNLDKFRLITKPRKAGKMCFSGADYTIGNKADYRQDLVQRIFQDLIAAAKAEGVEGRPKTVILSERPVIISEATATNSHFLSETSFEWTLERDEVA
jgi:hypothetical protein